VRARHVSGNRGLLAAAKALVFPGGRWDRVGGWLLLSLPGRPEVSHDAWDFHQYRLVDRACHECAPVQNHGPRQGIPLRHHQATRGSGEEVKG
jgi:hypothetical protein